jgi:phospholipase C
VANRDRSYAIRTAPVNSERLPFKSLTSRLEIVTVSFPPIKAIALSIFLAIALGSSVSGLTQTAGPATPDALLTHTPIKHLVIIFDEDVSFDHYFGTYPKAANPPGETLFTPAIGTPLVNGLSDALQTDNPNAANTVNGAGALVPFRLDPAQSSTASPNYEYTLEQQAFDGGKMDRFLKLPSKVTMGGSGSFFVTGLEMGHLDGNTVTALWNYAQHFALSDDFFASTFGGSMIGALNLISGQTNGALPSAPARSAVVDDGTGHYTAIRDIDPTGDTCSRTGFPTLQMTGRNIGDLLNAQHVSWGFFEGGFDLTATNANGTTGCARSSFSSIGARTVADYIPHHQPFQYYASTRNLAHTRPLSVATIGTSNDHANHQYDINDFFVAVKAGHFPAVSFLKAPAFQDAHAGYSDPLDEQRFLTTTLNFLQTQPEWRSTAVIVTYDASDGWYDHVSHIVNPSFSSSDAFSGPSRCGEGTPLSGVADGKPVQGRCGYGPRLPLLVISPFARSNFVDHTLTDQTSITRFIEDNWLGRKRLGQGSFDTIAGSLNNMFDFSAAKNSALILNTKTGTVK